MLNYCRITFVQSEHGRGYTASISGQVGDEGMWADSGYSQLRGVAFQPEDDDTSDGEWLRFVQDRLRTQGVRFLRQDQVGSYLLQHNAAPAHTGRHKAN